MDLKNLKIKIIQTKPFYLFEIENFLNIDLYNGLKKNFPFVKENLDLKRMTDFKNKKFAFQTNSKIYDDNLKENFYFKKFHDLVMSKKFFYFFYSKLYFSFLKSRIGYPKHILKLLRLPKRVDKLNKDSVFYNFSIFNKVKTEIQYSYILNMGGIVPHTDSGEKILSLMLYFPDNEKKEDDFYYKERSYGTQFWESKTSNFKNYHQEKINSDLFKKNSKELFKTSFKSNNLYGFIKNENSWHSVESVNVSENYIRKSININFYI